MLFSVLLNALVLAAPTRAVEETTPLVPWFVPRSASVGFFFNSPVVTPHFRVAWEGYILDQPRNALIWTAVVGSGVGLGLQKPMNTHYQHVALVGLGYRGDYRVVSWGFHVATGPGWYRAGYEAGSTYKFENRVLGYIEGHLQLGIRLTPHFRLGLYFGYASPFVFTRTFPGNTFVGGLDTGVVFDWR